MFFANSVDFLSFWVYNKKMKIKEAKRNETNDEN